MGRGAWGSDSSGYGPEDRDRGQSNISLNPKP